MELDNIRTFLAVVDHGGVLAAARALELPKQTVSRRLNALEAEVGAELVERARRPVALTQAGQVFADKCRGLLDGLDEAVRDARAEAFEPRGLLRIAAPQLLARRFLATVTADLLERFEALRIKLVATDDLDPSVPWTFDAVLWIGDLPDVAWRARKLGEASTRLCASPELLAAIDPPRAPGDLLGLPTIDYHRHLRAKPWQLRRGDTTVEVPAKPRLETNEPEVALAAALRGVGIASLPSFLVEPHVRSGALRWVLPQWRVRVGPLSLLYRGRERSPGRLEALLAVIDPVRLGLVDG